MTFFVLFFLVLRRRSKQKKMRITLYTLLLLIISVISSHAQSASDFEFSEMRKNKKNHIRSMVPLESGNSIIARFKESNSMLLYLMTNPKITFERLDKNMNSQKSVKTDLVTRKYKAGDKKVYEFTQILNDKIYVFYSVRAEKSKLVLYAVELDETTLSLSSEAKEVAVFNMKDKKSQYYVSIDFSNDKEHIIVYLTEKVKWGAYGESSHLVIQMLDKDLDKVWQYSLLKPVVEMFSDYKDIAVSKDGDLFIVEHQTQAFLRPKEEDLKPRYFINKIDASGAFVKERNLRFEGKEVNDIHLEFSPDEKLWLVGSFFDEHTSKNNVGGLIYMRFNKESLRSELRKFPSIDMDFYLEGKDERTVKWIEKSIDKGRKVRMKFVLRDLIHKADGGITLIGEEYSYSKSSRFEGGASSFHSFNDILIFDLNASGAVNWSRKILKRQDLSAGPRLNPAYGDFYFASFAHTISDGEIHFFFNDSSLNESSLDFDKYVEPTPSGLNSNFCVVKVDKDGEMEQEILFKSKDNKVVLLPASSSSINGAHADLLMIGRHYNRARFVRYLAN